MSPGRRREMADREHPKLPIVRQCALLGVARSSLYYRPKAVSEEDLSLRVRSTGSTWRPLPVYEVRWHAGVAELQDLGLGVAPRLALCLAPAGPDVTINPHPHYTFVCHSTAIWKCQWCA